MYPQGGEKKNKYLAENRINLTLLVMILGFLALLSIGIMALSIFRQLYPPALSAINKQLNYQGKLQYSTGAVVADGNYNMKFSIYGAPSGGTPLWTECGTTGTPTSRTVAVTNGIFSVLLGDTASAACPGGTNGNAIDLKFDSDSYYLGLTVGSDSEMIPRKRIGSSGYSFNADLLDGLDTSNAGGSAAFVPVTDGSGNLVLTQNLSLGGVFKASNGSPGAPSITFASDTDSGIFSAAANNLGISADGAAIAYFTTTTSYAYSSFYSPRFITPMTTDYPMTLTGRANDGASAVGVVLDNSTTLSTAGAKLVSIKNNTVEKAYIDKDGGAYFGGNVGIGTTGPSEKLDIVGNQRFTTAGSAIYALPASGYVTNLDLAAGGTAYLSNGAAVRVQSSGVGADGTILFSTNRGGIGVAERMRITNMGDVGIGTASPLAKLHVYAPTSVTTIYSENFDSSGTWTNGGTTVSPFTWSARSEVTADSGTYYWAYNNGVSDGYDTGAAIDYYSYSSSFDISTATSPVLDLKYMLNMEQIGTKNDKAFIEIVDAVDPTYVYQAWELTTSALTWTDFSQALSPWMGNIRVRVRIYTNSGLSNAGFGFRVDTVSVTDSAEADAAYFQGRVGINTLPSYALDVTSSGTRTVNAVNTTSGGIGGYFTVSGTNGVGIYGTATTSGTGVSGHSADGAGGVFLADDGAGLGGRGAVGQVGPTPMMMESARNIGVQGRVFLSDTDKNIGGEFYATGSSANNYGVTGNADSFSSAIQNWGGYFTATGDSSYGVQASVTGSGAAATNYGGHFTAAGGTGAGVYGTATYNSFGSGTTNYGGYFTSAGEAGRGVYGEASSSVGPNYGGYFTSAGTGLGSSGVFGTTSGKASGVYGVYGTATDTGAYVNYGGYFEAAGTGGAYGVYGAVTGATGTNFAVSGQASGSSTNWAGYFSGGQGLYASQICLGADICRTTWPSGGGSPGGATTNVQYNSAGAFGGENDFTWDDINNELYVAARIGVGVSNPSYPLDVTTSSDLYGAEIINSTAGGYAVYGNASDNSATANYGGYFTAAGASFSVGVYGEATDNTSVANYGGQFIARGDSGRGVYGEAPKTGAITNYGGQFVAAGDWGYGVLGIATGSSGSGVFGQASASGAVGNYGGQFSASGDWGYGVYASAPYVGVAGNTGGTAGGSMAVKGLAYDNTAYNYGGYFESYGPGGYGVYSLAADTTATNYGGVFTSNGIDGSRGVWGYATDTTAANYGVYGSSLSSSGTGVYGDAALYGVRGNSTTGYGVAGFLSGTTGRAVWGSAYNAAGTTTYGGYFNSSGTSGYGVYGSADSATGTNYGGYFTAAGGTGMGVYGEATYNSTATANYGGYFRAYGTNADTAGVYGESMSSTYVVANYGVRGVSNGIGSYSAGVYGTTAAAANSISGVYGYASNSGSYTNYGGFFVASGTGTGTSGVRGIANGAAQVYGIYGSTSSTTAGAAGVYGQSTGSSNATYGGRFTAASTTGTAVYGDATTNGATISRGGYFTAASTGTTTSGVSGLASGAGTVYGVNGQASASGAVTNYGGYFTAAGTTGTGVYGAASGTGANYGGSFYAAGATGTAVRGEAASTSANINYGGYFTAAGQVTGVAGVRGEAISSLEATTYGGHFVSQGYTGYGVYGVAQSGQAWSNYGGYFQANGTGADTAGVYGVAGGGTTGVSGVKGVVTSAGAVTNYGGWFSSAGRTGVGVYGIATYNSTATANYGGSFQAAGTGGARGVYGYSSGGSGTNYGVYGQVTSASGYSGYFTGGVGAYIGTALGINDTTPTEATLVVGNAGAGNIYATFATANSERLCWDASGASLITDCTGTPGDYAEEYGTTDASIEAGDIVIADASNPAEVITVDGIPGSKGWVLKSVLPYQGDVLGVVSTYPNEKIGQNFDPSENPRPITLNGRVPVKVNDQNGAIIIGDPITTSSTSGVGMKATKPGRIIGYALNTWSGSGQGAILVSFSPGWNDNGTIATDSTTSFFNDDFSFNKLGTADAVTTGYNSHDLTLLGSGWDGAVAQDVGMSFRTAVTDSTNYKLSVINNAGAEVAYIGGDGSMGLSGKFYPASPTGFQTDAYIFYGANYMRTNADGWSTGSFDFAEMFKSNETLEAGDIVSVDGVTNEYVKKSTGAYDTMVLGIVSTKPGFLAGTSVDFSKPLEDPGYPIALAGRVPTKVSTENGPIVPGDPLTASSVSGVAMKATEPGMAIGVALEGWSNPEVGKIIVFVNLSWYGTNGEMTPISELASLDLTGNLNMNGNYILNVAQIVGKDEVWSIDESGVFKVKFVGEDETAKEMFATTSPKVEMTISGTARLEKGGKVVDLTLVDEDFIKNASPDTAYKILVTPNEDCNGIYVSERTPFGFTVRETRAGTSEASFDWMVVARRKGYDDPEKKEAEPVLPAAPVEEPPVEEPAPEAPAEEPAPEPPVEEPAPEAPAEEPAPETP